jgi:hypothetical protein
MFLNPTDTINNAMLSKSRLLKARHSWPNHTTRTHAGPYCNCRHRRTDKYINKHEKEEGKEPLG